MQKNNPPRHIRRADLWKNARAAMGHATNAEFEKSWETIRKAVAHRLNMEFPDLKETT